MFLNINKGTMLLLVNTVVSPFSAVQQVRRFPAMYWPFILTRGMNGFFYIENAV